MVISATMALSANINSYLSKYKGEVFHNGTVMTLSNTIKYVLSCASDAETATIVYTCKAALRFRVYLEEMGHHQSQHPVTTYNTTSVSLIENTMISKQAKSNIMTFN